MAYYCEECSTPLESGCPKCDGTVNNKMAERDWEDANKLAFVMLVQTYVLKSSKVKTPEAAMVTVYDAMRCRKASLPTEALRAADQFIAWKLHGGSRPDWAEYPLTGGIAGL